MAASGRLTRNICHWPRAAGAGSRCCGRLSFVLAEVTDRIDPLPVVCGCELTTPIRPMMPSLIQYFSAGGTREIQYGQTADDGPGGNAPRLSVCDAAEHDGYTPSRMPGFRDAALDHEQRCSDQPGRQMHAKGVGLVDTWSGQRHPGAAIGASSTASLDTCSRRHGSAELADRPQACPAVCR